MAEKITEPSERFKEKVGAILSEANKKRNKRALILVLITFTSWARSYESTIARLRGYVGLLKEVIKGIMVKLDIDKLTFRRTTVQHVRVLTIEDEEAKKRLESVIGRRNAEEWIKKKVVKIPESKEVKYSLTKKGSNIIRSNPALLKKVDKALGNPSRIIVRELSKEERENLKSRLYFY